MLSSIAFFIGIERITGAAVGTMPGSPPWPATCTAFALTPAAFSRSPRRTPPQVGQPMPPVSSHGVPLAFGLYAERPEPAHSSMPCMVTVLKFFARSKTEKLNSLSTRPLMVRVCWLMSITGVSRLLRTNMRSVGVTSKSCSCAGTLPVSGRSECHCIALALSCLTISRGDSAGRLGLRERCFVAAERGERAGARGCAEEMAPRLRFAHE